MNGGIPPEKYSRKEELANVMTHGIGIILSVIGSIFLVRKAIAHGDLWHVVSFVIFGVSLLLMYASSTIYHLIQKPDYKIALRKLDHAMIYILIAGTYTPLLLTNLRSTSGWIMFAVIWLFALTGISIKLTTEFQSKWISAIIYLGMGWLAIFIAPTMFEKLSQTSIFLILSGGLFYSTGVFFYLRRTLRFHHAIWHLFVLGGSICHFFAIYFLI